MKKLLLTSAISALFLVGCGGSSSGSKSSKVDLDGTWTEITYGYTLGVNEDNVLYINNNDVYANFSGGDWESIFIEGFYEPEGGLVSPTGFYDFEEKYEEGKGLHIGKIQSSNNTEWVIKPKAEEGKSDLLLDVAAEKRDISGKTVLEVFFPNLDYLQKKNLLAGLENYPSTLPAILNTTLPANSYCLATRSVKANHDVIFADYITDDPSEPTYQNYKTAYENAINNTEYDVQKNFVYNSKFYGISDEDFPGWSVGYFSGYVDNTTFYGTGWAANKGTNWGYDDLYNYINYYGVIPSGLATDDTNAIKSAYENRCIYFNNTVKTKISAAEFDEVRNYWNYS